MATETPRKRPVRLIFLIYGLFALFISLALAAFAFRGNLPSIGAQPTPTPSIPPTETARPIPTVAATPGPGTPTETIAPTFVATAPPQPTATTTSGGIGGVTVENPLGLPNEVLAVIFAFTTLSGIASILKFTFDSVVALARFVGRFRRA